MKTHEELVKAESKLKSYDIKVIGFERIRAENKDAAREIFENMMRDKGYAVSDLRWKTVEVLKVKD